MALQALLVLKVAHPAWRWSGVGGAGPFAHAYIIVSAMILPLHGQGTRKKRSFPYSRVILLPSPPAIQQLLVIRS